MPSEHITFHHPWGKTGRHFFRRRASLPRTGGASVEQRFMQPPGSACQSSVLPAGADGIRIATSLRSPGADAFSSLMIHTSEIWLVNARGRIFEASEDELKQWIAEGAVVGTDLVKRGHLRWLALEKVPALRPLLEAALNTEHECVASSRAPAAKYVSEQDGLCYFHPDVEGVFACDVCAFVFCKACPKSFAGNIKICPLCDSLCRPAAEQKTSAVGAMNRPYAQAPGHDYGHEVAQMAEPDPFETFKKIAATVTGKSRL